MLDDIAGDLLLADSEISGIIEALSRGRKFPRRVFDLNVNRIRGVRATVNAMPAGTCSASELEQLVAYIDRLDAMLQAVLEHVGAE